MKRVRLPAEEIARIKALVPLAALIGQETSLEKQGAEYLGLCPFHAESTPSFRVYRDRAFCFGCGWRGDTIDWLRERERLSFVASLDRLRQLAGTQEDLHLVRRQTREPKDYGWSPVSPVPGDAPPLVLRNGWTERIFNPKRQGEQKEWTSYKPARVHAYLDEQGQVLGYVLRVEFGAGKKYTPTVTYCTSSDGDRRWCLIPFARPRPLYGLNRLALLDSTAPIALVEGEKTADATQHLLPLFVCLTWSGGAKSYRHSDFTRLASRKVICVQTLMSRVGQRSTDDQNVGATLKVFWTS